MLNILRADETEISHSFPTVKGMSTKNVLKCHCSRILVIKMRLSVLCLKFHLRKHRSELMFSVSSFTTTTLVCYNSIPVITLDNIVTLLTNANLIKGGYNNCVEAWIKFLLGCSEQNCNKNYLHLKRGK